MRGLEGIEMPEAYRRALARFADEASVLLGPNLVGITLYGSAARGEFDPSLSDVNLLVAVEDDSTDVLDRLRPAVARAQRTCRLRPLVLSEADLKRSADVFPVRWQDIRAHHRPISGRDLLEGVPIDLRFARVSIEQDLRSLQARLRLLYLAGDDPDPGALWFEITRLMPPLRALVELRGVRDLPAGFQGLADIAAASQGIDLAGVRTLIGSHGGIGLAPGRRRALLADFIRAADSCARLADTCPDPAAPAGA